VSVLLHCNKHTKNEEEPTQVVENKGTVMTVMAHLVLVVRH